MEHPARAPQNSGVVKAGLISMQGLVRNIPSRKKVYQKREIKVYSGTDTPDRPRTQLERERC